MKGGSGDLCSLIYLIPLCFLLSTVQTDHCGNGFTDLKAVSDLRSVKLSWKYICRVDPAGFVVKICERSRREPSYYFCFERLFKRDGTPSRGHESQDVLKTDNEGRYVAVVHDLRMMTDYTATVEPVDAENFLLSPGRDMFLDRWRAIGAKTSFTTKGFSAYVRKCFFNSSEIVVNTGPFFGGKISVEDATDPRCKMYGDRNNNKDVYVLHIDHEICGSVIVNGSSVRTIVAIHESSSVVTHNSRKFLVQCNFLPETFTVEAAFKVPQSDPNPPQASQKTEGHSDDDDESNDIFTYEGYKQSHVKDSRISSVQAASVLQPRKPEYDSQVIGLISIIIIIAVVLFAGLAFGIWWFFSSRKYRSGDSLNSTASVPGSTITFYQYGGRAADDDNDCRIDQSDASLPHSHCSDYLFRQNNDPSPAEVVLVSLKACK